MHRELPVSQRASGKGLPEQSQSERVILCRVRKKNQIVSKTAQRMIYIYAVTTAAQTEGDGPLYKAIHQPLIAKVSSDTKGFFQCKVPPGRYSVFTGEQGQQFFAGVSNLKGELNPVEVVAHKVSTCDIIVDHKAAY